MDTAHDLAWPHRFVRGTAPASPPLLLLHGTGGNEDDLLPLGQAVAKGATLLSPRGTVLENGMPRFFRRLAEGVFDEPDLRHRTAELAEFIEDATGPIRRRRPGCGRLLQRRQYRGIATASGPTSRSCPGRQLDDGRPGHHPFRAHGRTVAHPYEPPVRHPVLAGTLPGARGNHLQLRAPCRGHAADHRGWRN